MSMKNSNDIIWNRTSDFRFVAQHLNHCATAVPWEITVTNQIYFCEEIKNRLSSKKKRAEEIIWALVGRDDGGMEKTT